MATIFENATDVLNDTLERVAGVPVTIARLGLAFDTVAVLGRTIFAQQRRTGTGSGPAVVWGDRDFLIRVENYQLDPQEGVAVEPAEGDRIFDQTTGLTYEIKRIPDEPAYRYDGPERKTWRIHTKRITVDT